MADPLAAAQAALQRGEVIGIPTDTVYGLACDPADAAAVARIYELKHRPSGLELSLLGANLACFDGLVLLSRRARFLAEHFWPGPLSVVAAVGMRRLAVPRFVDTLSVRVPAHPLLQELLLRTGPLATTSANRHGEPDVVTAQQVSDVFGAELGAVLDGGRGAGQASTIIDCSVEPPRLLREGPISIAELRPLLERPLTRGDNP